MADVLLEASDLHVYYGASHVLHGVDFAVRVGEAVGLMGRNGMGKTTLLRSMLGIVSPRSGTVRVRGYDAAGWPTFRITIAATSRRPTSMRSTSRRAAPTSTKAIDFPRRRGTRAAPPGRRAPSRCRTRRRPGP